MSLVLACRRRVYVLVVFREQAVDAPAAPPPWS
jgi:hypothetical protein